MGRMLDQQSSARPSNDPAIDCTAGGEVATARKRVAPNRLQLLRFFSKVLARADGCWIWTGAINDKGRAVLQVDGRVEYAPRVAHEWFVGPIPDGFEADHLCRAPLCVNPAHLEAVSGEENRRRATWIGGVCKHGHVMTPDNVSVMQKGGGKTARVCRTCRRLNARKETRLSCRAS